MMNSINFTTLYCWESKSNSVTILSNIIWNIYIIIIWIISTPHANTHNRVPKMCVSWWAIRPIFRSNQKIIGYFPILYIFIPNQISFTFIKNISIYDYMVWGNTPETYSDAIMHCRIFYNWGLSIRIKINKMQAGFIWIYLSHIIKFHTIQNNRTSQIDLLFFIGLYPMINQQVASKIIFLRSPNLNISGYVPYCSSHI